MWKSSPTQLPSRPGIDARSATKLITANPSHCGRAGVVDGCPMPEDPTDLAQAEASFLQALNA